MPENPPTKSEQAVEPQFSRLNFDLLTLFELMTVVSIIILVGNYIPALAAALAGSLLAAMFFTATFVGGKQNRQESVSFFSRYKVFVCAFVIAAMVLIVATVAFVGGAALLGSLVHGVTHDDELTVMAAFLGGTTLAVTTIAGVWFFGLGDLINRR